MTRIAQASRWCSPPPLALALVHALDDAFVHRGPGLGLGQHALAGLIAIVAGVAGVLAFPSLRPGLRAALAFSFGGLALVNGDAPCRPRRAARRGRERRDRRPRRRGGARPARPRGRDPLASSRRGHVEVALARRSGRAAGTLFVLGPISLGIVASHKWREPVGDPPSAAYRDVSFEASDGLDIAGWYRPSRNGAAVLVVHGGSSDRKGSLAHAEMLARPRLRRAGLRRPRARRERGQREQLRLGLGQGRRRRARVPAASATTSTRSGSARSASRPAPTC